MLLSSLPPTDLIDGGAAACDGTKKAAVQMYAAPGEAGLFPSLVAPSSAGVKPIMFQKRRDISKVRDKN